MNKRNRYKNQINISGIKIRENKLLLETGIDISAKIIAKIEYNVRTVTDYEFLALAKVLNMNILILIKDFFN